MSLSKRDDVKYLLYPSAEDVSQNKIAYILRTTFRKTAKINILDRDYSFSISTYNAILAF